MLTIKDTDARMGFEKERQTPADLELEPLTSEDEDYDSAPSEYQISAYPADFTLEVLHHKWITGDIEIPVFQRSFVWNQAQASKLVESFLVGLPVPAVYLYSERESQKFLVIDGQQRLKSIFYYFEGYFNIENQGVRRIFKLTGLNPESKFSSKRFEDLQDEDKRKLKNAVLRAFVVQQLEPNDDTSMYHIFERLNTGGTSLKNQEIRNCLYHGGFIAFLEDINREPSWKLILGKKEPDKRGKDIELLVRFFAMRDISAYKEPMKDFLSKFMNKHRNASKETLDESRKIFTQTCERVIESLGEKPFHVRKGLNVAVFDSVMTAFPKHLDAIPEDIKGRYNNLVKDDEFVKNTRSSTTNVEIVKRRFHKAETVLFS